MPVRRHPRPARNADREVRAPGRVHPCGIASAIAPGAHRPSRPHGKRSAAASPSRSRMRRRSIARTGDASCTALPSARSASSADRPPSGARSATRLAPRSSPRSAVSERSACVELHVRRCSGASQAVVGRQEVRHLRRGVEVVQQRSCASARPTASAREHVLRHGPPRHRGDHVGAACRIDMVAAARRPDFV